MSNTNADLGNCVICETHGINKGADILFDNAPACFECINEHKSNLVDLILGEDEES